MKDKKKNIVINNIKAFCIFSVICAHTTSGSFFTNRLLQIIGICGVPCFFFLSGYLFSNHNKYTFKQFMKKKIIRIVTPWVMVGSITYIINSLSGSEKEKFMFLNWIKYLIGYHSHLYYLTILFIFYLIFWKKCKIVDGIKKMSLLISLLYVIYIEFIGLNNLKIYPYLNPLFWIVFFSLGIKFKEKIKENLYLLSKLNKLSWIINLFCVFMCLVIWNFVNSFISYFSIFTFILEILVVLISMSLISKNKYLKLNIFSEIGEKTLFIYLTHIVVIGLFNYILSFNTILDMLKPIIVFILYGIIITFLNKICRKYKKINNIFKLFGF